MLRITEQAHQRIRPCLAPGDCAIDATAGNGHDTLFLARLVGETGTVLACDLQPEALTRTARLLEAHGIPNAILLACSHANLNDAIPPEYHGRIGAVMFNLGYLPGGDKTYTTTTSSSLQGLQQALALLRVGGIVTVIAYPGHPGGTEETAAVEGLLRGLNPAEYTVSLPAEPIASAPRLSCAVRVSS